MRSDEEMKAMLSYVSALHTMAIVVFLKTFYLCVRARACLHTRIHIRGQLAGIGSLLPSTM